MGKNAIISKTIFESLNILTFKLGRNKGATYIVKFDSHEKNQTKTKQKHFNSFCALY